MTWISTKLPLAHRGTLFLAVFYTLRPLMNLSLFHSPSDAWPVWAALPFWVLVIYQYFQRKRAPLANAAASRTSLAENLQARFDHAPLALQMLFWMALVALAGGMYFFFKQ
jgi:hypothetical protein